MHFILKVMLTASTYPVGGRGLQGGKETVNLTNLELKNYVKESRERLLTAARYVDIDLIEPAQETKIEAKKQKKEERTISWDKKNVVWPVCMTN